MPQPSLTPTRRGRPPGRQNMLKVEASGTATSSQTPPKRRGPGRPPGRRNAQNPSLQGTPQKRKRSGSSRRALTKCPECALWLKGEETLAEHSRSCGTDCTELEEFTLLRGGRKLLRLSPSKAAHSAEASEDESMEETTIGAEVQEARPFDDQPADMRTIASVVGLPIHPHVAAASSRASDCSLCESEPTKFPSIPEVEGLTGLDKSEIVNTSMDIESAAEETNATSTLPQYLPVTMSHADTHLLQGAIVLNNVDRTAAVDSDDVAVECSPFVLGSLVTEFTTSPEPILYLEDLEADISVAGPSVALEVTVSQNLLPLGTSAQSIVTQQAVGQSKIHDEPLPPMPSGPGIVPSGPQIIPADDDVADDDESVYELMYPDWDVMEALEHQECSPQDTHSQSEVGGSKLLAMPDSEAWDLYGYETASEYEEEEEDILIPPTSCAIRTC